MLSHYFQPDQPLEVTEAAMIDWISALHEFPLAFIGEACKEYVRDEPRRRPSPGEIYGRVSKKIEFRNKHQKPRTAIAPPEPELEKTQVQRERAEAIVQGSGFTASLTEALRTRRMATSRDDLDKPNDRVPHWSEKVAPGGPEMEALRRARIKAGSIPAKRMGDTQ